MKHVGVGIYLFSQIYKMKKEQTNKQTNTPTNKNNNNKTKTKKQQQQEPDIRTNKQVQICRTVCFLQSNILCVFSKNYIISSAGLYKLTYKLQIYCAFVIQFACLTNFFVWQITAIIEKAVILSTSCLLQ